MTHRRGRGAATERAVTEYLNGQGWPYATVQRGPGPDLTNTPGIDFEIKARRDLDLPGWLRQVDKRAGDRALPVLIVRPDGYGPTTIGSWPMVMPLRDGLAVLRQAGYSEVAV